MQAAGVPSSLTGFILYGGMDDDVEVDIKLFNERVFDPAIGTRG